MGTLEELSPATGEESSLMEILGTAFFDDDFEDSRSSSGAVEVRGRGEGSRSSENMKVPVGRTTVLLKADGPRPGHYIRPRPLMEIYSVCFLQFEKQSFEDMYGVILVEALFPYVIFERLFGDPLRIDSEGYIRLIGPRRAIEAFDSLSLTSCLFNSRVQETPNCQGDSMLTLFYEPSDQFLCKEFITDYGPLEVQYVGYKNGAEAILEVSLIDWEGKGECANTEVQIFGTVRTRNNKVSNREAQSLLFYKKSEEAIRIGYGDVIPLPLTRKAAALPLGSTLMVDLCIWHRCNNLSMDGVLVEDTVPFDSSLVSEEESCLRKSWQNYGEGYLEDKVH